MIRVAIPNKGQLFEPTLELLQSCDYRVSQRSRSLSAFDEENGIEFFFLRPGDIPIYVANGILDAGVTGKDFVAERGVSVTNVLELNFGHSRLCVATPIESKITKIEDLISLRIATSFPRIVSAYFKRNDLKLVELEGAVEISIKLGIADAIVDIVETGTTLKQAGLGIIGDALFKSNAALIAHDGWEQKPELQILRARVEGHLVAEEYMMVEYDAPSKILDQACMLTPGIESPTVSPLRDSAWHSVKSMIRKKQANSVMDKLAHLGCKGIILTKIESARI